ncbi:hypothetical protein U6M95_12515, partial [Cutibacterium acnes]
LMNEKGRFDKPNADKGEGKVVQILNHGKRVSSEPESVTSYVGKCCYCKETGHWKRDCIKFLEDSQEMEKMYGTSSSGIVLLIQVLHKYWILVVVLIFLKYAGPKRQ